MVRTTVAWQTMEAGVSRVGGRQRVLRQEKEEERGEEMKMKAHIAIVTNAWTPNPSIKDVKCMCTLQDAPNDDRTPEYGHPTRHIQAEERRRTTMGVQLVFITVEA